MTVRELIDDLTKWVKNGNLEEDSEVYVSESIIPYEDTPLYKASFCGGSEPCFDKANPTKRALFITEIERVPNFSMKGSPYKQYGDLEITRKMSKLKEQMLVDQYDIRRLKSLIENYNKNLNEIKAAV